MAKTTIFFLSFLLVFLIRSCESRYLQSNSSLQSDGVDDNIDDQYSPLQLFRGGLESEGECSHMYGFLPCSDNLLGDVFQILVYEYLLFLGESYVSLGSEIVFTILGTGVFGASAFHILGALPEGMIVIVSGLSQTKELAQATVMTGVGMLAGSTTFLLTLLWGTCLVFGSRSSVKSKSKDSETQIIDNSRYKRYSSYITGSGVTIDAKTNYSAMILFISLVPIIILQIPMLVTILYSSERIVILISLVISATTLLSYFFYQIFYPWIQTRKLEFVKNEHLMEDFLKHIKKQASGMLLTDKGTPNLPVIRRLFRNIDYNKDAGLTQPEVKKIIETEKLHEDGIVAVMKELDIDQNQKISEEEFVNVFTKWLLKTKLTNKASYSKATMDQIYEQRVENNLRSKQLVSEISELFRYNAIGSLITDDGKPNLQAVKRLFENFDQDGDKYVSLGELTKAIQGIQSEKTDLQDDITHLMKELDRNEDQLINEDEFVNGFSKYLGSNMTLDDVYLEAWEAVEKVVNEKATRGPNVDSHLWDWAKAIWLLSVGILMLSFLGNPLTDSVMQFSDRVGIPSFFVTFVLLPLATNYRKARSAIRSASDSKARTTSLAFSEIYGNAFINNLFGLSLFLAIVYGRGLAWEFSAEMLLIVVVCVVMGGIGCLGRIPAWTCVVAYLLYPFSLAFVYVLNVVFGWA